MWSRVGSDSFAEKGLSAMFKSAAFAILLVLVALPGLNLAWRALVNWLVDDDRQDASIRSTSTASHLAQI